MALWNVAGQIVDDSQEGVSIPEYGSLTLPGGQLIEWGDKSVFKVPEYPISQQFQGTVPWTEYGLGTQDLNRDYATGYLPSLLDLRAQAAAGTLRPQDRAYYEQMVAEARAVPMRDVSGLTYNAGQQTAATLHGGSPDLGNLMLTIADKMDAGTATEQERALFRETEQQLRYQDWKASVPQPSDAFNPLGDNLFGALGILGLGATGGLAAAPLFAGGAGLATTLGSLGTLSGIAGTGAGVLGQALDQPWLRTLGTALGAAGGIAGGVGGLANLASRGISSLGDVGKLLSSVGKITGAAGRVTGNRALGQAGSYLGTAGQLGSGLDTLSTALGQGNLGGLAAGLGRVAGGVMPLLHAAQGAQQPAPMRPRPPQMRPQMRPPMPTGPILAADWLRPGPGAPWASPSVLANLRR